MFTWRPALPASTATATGLDHRTIRGADLREMPDPEAEEHEDRLVGDRMPVRERDGAEHSTALNDAFTCRGCHLGTNRRGESGTTNGRGRDADGWGRRIRSTRGCQRFTWRS